MRTALRRVYLGKLAELRPKGAGFAWVETALGQLDAGEPVRFVPRRLLGRIVSDLPDGSTFTVHPDCSVTAHPTRKPSERVLLRLPEEGEYR